MDSDVRLPLRSQAVKANVSVGGSSGRVLLLLREDWRSVADADVDDARALAKVLQGEGFNAELRAVTDAIDVRAYDLVHAFGAAHPAQLLAPLTAAREAGLPVVLTPALEDIAAGGVWGSRIVSSLLRTAHDETELAEHLQMLRMRRLEAPGADPRRQEPFAGYDATLRALMKLADAAVVSGPDEERFLRSAGFAGSAVHGPAHLAAAHPDEAAAAIAGTGPYVLSYAPIEARNNQYLLMRAALQAGLPLVLAGQVVDIEFYQTLQRVASERVVFVPKMDDALAQALYRSARVYADVAWIPYGLARVAAAGASGCALVVSRDGYAARLWPQAVWAADPCSVDSIAVALGDAWMHAAEGRAKVSEGAARIGAWADPGTALRQTVAAYAAAQQARVHA